MSSSSQHTRITLASRPVGAPTNDNFLMVSGPIPQPENGQILLRTVYLSLDPYMRGRMSDADSYAKPVQIGETMVGGTVSQVEVSNHPDFKTGDWVLGYTGWQSHAISDGSGLHKLDGLAQPSLALGVLGMPGFTAYMGLLEIGQPKAGETVVVAAATGAVGSVVGQIAKLKGCRVVGIAGGAEKCRYAVEELGFDACIDHRSPSLSAELAAACPQGIDVYFENVGGAVFDAVLPLLNTSARVPLCGLIAQYNATKLPNGPDRSPLLMRTLLTKRIRMQGFIIFDDYGHRYPEFLQAMGSWISSGAIRHREDIVTGLENAPQAFAGLLEGRNFGKLIIQVSEINSSALMPQKEYHVKVLIVLTSHDQLGNTGHKTGFWLEEFAAPYYVFKDAGATITLASPKGGQPPLDPKSDEPDFQTAATERFKADVVSQALLEHTHKLSEIEAANYDAVFYPGGHGPLWDLAEDQKSITLIEEMYNAGKLVGAVCHAPGIFRHTKTADGESLVKGKKVTGFTNTEEDAVQLTNIVPFLVEDMLIANGGQYSKGPDWMPFAQIDGHLITGQNPASSELVAHEMLKMLQAK